MERNARLLAAALAAVLGAAILSASVAAHALPGNSLLIEHWDGAAWSVTPAPGPSGGSELSAVTAVSSTNVWAVGSFAKTTGTTRTWHPLAEHYDGTSWSPVVLPTANKRTQSALVAVSGSSANDVWAVGSVGSTTLVEHFDGASWKLVPSLGTAGSKLTGVAAVSRRDAWAVGSIRTKTGKTLALIEHWNGSVWRPVRSLSPYGAGTELFAIAAWSKGNVWAVGDYRFRGHTRSLTLHWNGAHWKTMWTPSSPSWQNSLRAVTMVAPWNAWAVGASHKAGSYRSFAENWHICSWYDASAPSPDVLDLTAVSALSGRDIWAVGSSGGTAQTLAEHWNGKKWTVEPTVDPQLPDALRGVAAVSDTDVWAVGSSNAP